MHRLLWLIPIAVFVLNPGFACSDEPQFQYGAAEMRAAVEGDWTFTITPEGGTAIAVTVHLEQAATSGATTTSRPQERALVRAAHACGTRTLVKSAAACVDVSEMPLAVTYVSGDASFATAMMSGGFSVLGLTFGSGMLSLNLGSFQIRAQVGADGSLTDPQLGPPGTAGALTVSRP